MLALLIFSTLSRAEDEEAFGRPLPNATAETRRFFAVGNSFFTEPWIVAPGLPGSRSGLGPLFNARACADCHFRDGRGTFPLAGEPLESLLIRISPDPFYGQQLATFAIPGAQPEVTAHVDWQLEKGTFPDGEAFELRHPILQITAWHYGPPASELAYSLRMAQPVFGLGLLEAVPETELLAWADAEDRDHDGISGRPNLVGGKLGRFGWKASMVDLRMQTATAFLRDLGVRSAELPDGDFTAAQRPVLGKFSSGRTPEISEVLFSRVLTYLQALAPPPQRDAEDASVLRGRKLFTELHCAQCHRETLHTATKADLAELQGQTFYPFTDLLLHDLGPGLADHRPDAAATGVEWRTPPLWGLGLNEMVNGHVNFLHDGRARTLTEAILWHAGESAAATDAFRALPQAGRSDLLRFLNSL